MKRTFLFWLCVLLAGYESHAQTTFFTYGSAWKYLDNGSDQGTAWRAPGFNDAAWSTGNGKFGYGLPGLTTIVNYGPNINQKYITTYFRKTISIANPAMFSSFTGGVLRDDGIVVYVNGTEVYRNRMKAGTVTYQTLGQDASDNASVTQFFDISNSQFVSGDNVIAVEIHQKTVTNFDLGFDMQLQGMGAAQDLTPPVVLSINRQSPASPSTSDSTLTFRIAFSEKVRGIDAADFTLMTVSGTAAGELRDSSVKAVNADSIAYDVTAYAVQPTGVLRLDLNGSGTGITDTAGNGIAAGFENGETYTIESIELPVVTGINRQQPVTEVTSASAVTYRVVFSKKVQGVDAADFTLMTVSGTAAGELRDSSVKAVNADSIAYDVTAYAVQPTGVLRLDLNGSGTGITDTAGNGIAAGFENGETYTIESNGAPVVTSISRLLPASEVTDTNAVTFQVVFSKKVQGVDAADFILHTSGGNVRGTLMKIAMEATSVILTDAVAPAGADSTAWNVMVRAISGSGSLRLDVKNNNTGITDAGGNALQGGFTGGQSYTINANPYQGFTSLSDVNPITISTTTREIPQGKIWNYDGKWWSILSTSDGTKVFRLDGTGWTDVLSIATAGNARSDCRVVGSLVHAILFRGANNTSYLVSLEYDPVLHTYKKWSQRTSNVNIVFESGTLTTTLDIDTTNRLWLASNNSGNIVVRHSDPPYSTWSSPVVIASGITSSDICAITALPSGKIGVFWSNQNVKRFGFRTHNDGDGPTLWSDPEVPASQSALVQGNGMADDYINILAGSDGSLYCAVKTGYDKDGLPTISLLVRRPNGTWDNLYPVTSSKEGNRPIVVLNEALGKIRVFYSEHLNNFDGTRSSDILYRESSLSSIAFGPPITLMSGKGLNRYEYTTSTHQVYNPDIVIMASDENASPLQTVCVLASDPVTPETMARVATAEKAPVLTMQAEGEAKTNNLRSAALARPNPFTNSTTIEFSLSQAGRYTIRLYDFTGRMVKVVKQGFSEAGIRNNVRIDGAQLPNGLYQVNIQTDEQVRTLKLLKY
ncbi:T9SS type A sorting domain-containing protein [Niastella populi]|uniref:Secretion system C-terminal sorting domain-containing protein n=1 Tax=Niastella populi TaxID=550983 RepID=A0A1V9EZW4_9BACT|nr:T9SS type A sorting domain-containing protein [Niastella populi]OQP51691.1 hypothetical protein A4R26_29375 [Niastella populi]